MPVRPGSTHAVVSGNAAECPRRSSPATAPRVARPDAPQGGHRGGSGGGRRSCHWSGRHRGAVRRRSRGIAGRRGRGAARRRGRGIAGRGGGCRRESRRRSGSRRIAGGRGVSRRWRRWGEEGELEPVRGVNDRDDRGRFGLGGSHLDGDHGHRAGVVDLVDDRDEIGGLEPGREIGAQRRLADVDGVKDDPLLDDRRGRREGRGTAVQDDQGDDEQKVDRDEQADVGATERIDRAEHEGDEVVGHLGL